MAREERMAVIRKANSNNDYAFVGFFVIALTLSLLLSYLAYFVQSQFNLYQAFASLTFWCALLALVIWFPLRYTAKLFSKYVRSLKGFVIFVAYMSVHLIAYGFILEGIVSSVVSSASYYTFSVQPSISISASVVYPASAVSIFVSYLIFPITSIAVPPIFGASLSLYSITMAIIMGVLVQVNIMKALELKSMCSARRRSAVFVVLPIIGVVGGASCCLSLPLFIAFLALPAAALSSPAIKAAYYIAYFLFPPATAVVLKLNLDSINRISRRFSS